MDIPTANNKETTSWYWPAGSLYNNNTWGTLHSDGTRGHCGTTVLAKLRKHPTANLNSYTTYSEQHDFYTLRKILGQSLHHLAPTTSPEHGVQHAKQTPHKILRNWVSCRVHVHDSSPYTGRHRKCGRRWCPKARQPDIEAREYFIAHRGKDSQVLGVAGSAPAPERPARHKPRTQLGR